MNYADIVPLMQITMAIQKAHATGSAIGDEDAPFFGEELQFAGDELSPAFLTECLSGLQGHPVGREWYRRQVRRILVLAGYSSAEAETIEHAAYVTINPTGS